MEKISIEQFLDDTGRIIQMPSRKAARRQVLHHLSAKFTPGVIYAEREINEICDRWHTFNDYFLLRRELVDAGFLMRKRDGSAYWLGEAPTQLADPL